ncbi:MAG: 30S ribosomal protein S12 methylthiotransferase RimO, partial [Candidatus Zixiibacteriota bacterium]
MKFYVHKLGCPKNDVDADYIYAKLISEGHQPVNDPEKADSVIVNTCGFIDSAKEQSIEEILKLGQLKKKTGLKTLYATGCLSQRYGDELLSEIPELDGAFGLGALDSLANAVSLSDKLKEVVRMEPRKLGYLNWKNRFISDNFPYAYMKISDGCNRNCSYCAIPSIRGKYRSRSIDSIIRETQFLAENGKKEIILVSQEATLYGCESGKTEDIIQLLEAFEEVDGIEWVRLMYLHPAKLSNELIEYLAVENKTLNYYDLPLQHINNEILFAMNRQVTRDIIEKHIDNIRKADSEAILRTTFIVGFPGETDKQFQELLDFIEKTEFDRLGVFTYSAEEGTVAEKMENQIPEDIKSDRMDQIMMLQQEIAFNKNNSLIGEQKEVIIDRLNEDK